MYGARPVHRNWKELRLRARSRLFRRPARGLPEAQCRAAARGSGRRADGNVAETRAADHLRGFRPRRCADGLADTRNGWTAEEPGVKMSIMPERVIVIANGDLRLSANQK